jgi:hypothetical protein
LIALPAGAVLFLLIAEGTNVATQGVDVHLIGFRPDIDDGGNDLRKKFLHGTYFVNRQTAVSFAIAVNALAANPLL